MNKIKSKQSTCGIWMANKKIQTIFEEKSTQTCSNIRDIQKFIDESDKNYPDIHTLPKTRIKPDIKFPTAGRFKFIKLLQTGPANMFPNSVHYEPLKLLPPLKPIVPKKTTKGKKGKKK